tara:strand:+ start:272 stop:433 length:162 start_codon:yes stop_codon:yes gene_type:complete
MSKKERTHINLVGTGGVSAPSVSRKRKDTKAKAKVSKDRAGSTKARSGARSAR